MKDFWIIQNDKWGRGEAGASPPRERAEKRAVLGRVFVWLGRKVLFLFCERGETYPLQYDLRYT